MKRILVIAIAVMLCMGSALASTQSLNVSGTGAVYMPADRVSATLGVTMQGEDLAVLQQRVNETIVAICDALVAAGLEEKNISTSYIYINPRYDYSENVERMIGYSIDNSLTITTENMDSIGAYIDAAFAAGANSFNSIEFSVKDDSAARKQALELAVQDAMEKAQVIANAAGCSLGAIIEISESTQQDYYYYNNTSGSRKYEAAAADAVAGTTVRAAQVNVSANVQITYALASE